MRQQNKDLQQQLMQMRISQAAIAEEDNFVEEMKAKSGPSLLQEKLRQRNAKDDSVPS